MEPYQLASEPLVAQQNQVPEQTNPLLVEHNTPLSGSIQGSSGPSTLSRDYLNAALTGEDRRAPTSTIDETVSQTLTRDVLAVWSKMKLVLWPRYLLQSKDTTIGLTAPSSTSDIAQTVSDIAHKWRNAGALLQTDTDHDIKDWDLWGPLIFCLLLSLLLSITKTGNQAEAVFSGVFAIIWIGEAAVTLQIKLLGGNISFLQSICIIGYTLFPLVIAAVLSAVQITVLVRLPLTIILVCWSLAAGISILRGSGVVKNRVAIATYPLLVFYIGLGCLCLIS